MIYYIHQRSLEKGIEIICRIFEQKVGAREKERDLTQSYDKSPYTNRNIKMAKWQHKQRHKKVQLHSGYGPT